MKQRMTKEYEAAHAKLNESIKCFLLEIGVDFDQRCSDMDGDRDFLINSFVLNHTLKWLNGKSSIDTDVYFLREDSHTTYKLFGDDVEYSTPENSVMMEVRKRFWRTQGEADDETNQHQ